MTAARTWVVVVGGRLVHRAITPDCPDGPGWREAVGDEATRLLASAEAVRRVVSLSFRRRLGTPVRSAITLAAARALLERGDPGLQMYLDDLNAAPFVDLDGATTRAGIATMRAAGLLDEATAAALVLDATAEEIADLDAAGIPRA